MTENTVELCPNCDEPYHTDITDAVCEGCLEEGCDACMPDGLCVVCNESEP